MLPILLIIQIIQHIKFGLNPSFGSRDRVQTSFCVCVCGGGGQIFTLKVLALPLK